MSSVRKISDLSDSDVAALIDSFDDILCDCDGVLYRSGQVLSGSNDLIRHLVDKAGKRIFYVSNNAAKTRDQYVVDLGKMGFPVKKDHVFHAGYVAADYLKGHKGKVYLLGPKEVCVELDNAGVRYEYKQVDPMTEKWNDEVAADLIDDLDPEVDRVMVSYDVNFSYVKVVRACNYLQRDGCEFLATDVDSTFPIAGGLSLPGTGPFVAAVGVAAGRAEPTVLAKPSETVFKSVKTHFPDVDPKRTIIFGDRAESDILLGRRCGLLTLMVGSGVDTWQSVEKSEVDGKSDLVPHYWADNLGQLWDRVKKMKN